MAYSRLVARVGIFSVGLMLAVACGTDDEPGNGGNGAAGQGGDSGGNGGTSAGSVNKAGSGGTTAGTGGKGGGGKGGNGQGGEPLSGAAGATPGGAPSEGGMDAGGAAGMGGTAGMSGEAGAGGASEPNVLQCVYTCMVPEDCKSDFVEATCDEGTHRCVMVQPTCTADKECMPLLSVWSATCVSTKSCANDQLCISWDGQGYCATVPDNGSCAVGAPTKLPSISGGGDVEVCASQDARCFDGGCKPGCGDSLSQGCGDGKGDTCSMATGLCVCQDGKECASGVCGKEGRCVQCVTDDDCPDPDLDKCYGGTCGCSGAEVCFADLFPAAPAACE